DVLRDPIEQPPDAALLPRHVVRPVGGEDVVGPPAQQQGVHVLHPGLHLAAHHGVGERRLPTPEPEAAAGVLLRPAGTLGDAVEGGEQVDADSSGHAASCVRAGWRTYLRTGPSGMLVPWPRPRRRPPPPNRPQTGSGGSETCRRPQASRSLP